MIYIVFLIYYLCFIFTCCVCFYIYYFYYFILIILVDEIFVYLEKKKIKKLNIIPLDKNIDMYLFVNEDNEENVKFKHPFMDYYFNSQDLSINFKCYLKWIRCGHSLLTFFVNLLNKPEFIIFNFESIFKDNNTIQILDVLKNIKKEKHILEIHIINNWYNSLIDGFAKIYIVDENFNIELFIEDLNNTNDSFLKTNDNTNNKAPHSENDLIEFKLKLNILEYLSLSSKQIFLMFEISENSSNLYNTKKNNNNNE